MTLRCWVWWVQTALLGDKSLFTQGAAAVQVTQPHSVCALLLLVGSSTPQLLLLVSKATGQHGPRPAHAAAAGCARGCWDPWTGAGSPLAACRLQAA